MKIKNLFEKIGAGFKKTIAPIITASALALATLPASAGSLQQQIDTNSLAVASTNTYKLFGDLSGSFTNGQTMSTAYIDSSKAIQTVASFGGFFTNSTAGASNILFRVAGTGDVATWTNSIQTFLLTVPANTTNWVSGTVVITSPVAGYGWRTTENTNAAGVTARANSLFFKVVNKNVF